MTDVELYSCGLAPISKLAYMNFAILLLILFSNTSIKRQHKVQNSFNSILYLFQQTFSTAAPSKIIRVLSHVIRKLSQIQYVIEWQGSQYYHSDFIISRVQYKHF